MFRLRGRCDCRAENNRVGPGHKQVVSWFGEWDASINETENCLLTRASEALVARRKNGLFSIGAIRRTKDLGVVMTGNYVLIDECKADVRKAGGAL